MSWNYARVWERLAAAVGDRTAIVGDHRRLTFAELDARAERVAALLEGAGLEPGDVVAIDLVNGPEYLESFFGALKARCTPVNVNYRYVGHELGYLLEDSKAAALVHHEQFAPVVAAALETAPAPRLVLQVPDGTGRSPVRSARPYESALASAGPREEPRRSPSGDDLIVIYTGGTTGKPKGVMWRNDDLYVALWQVRRPGTEPPDPVEWCTGGGRAPTSLPASPLMHGTALFITLSTLSGGGTVVLAEEPGLDPERIWSSVEAHRVEVLTIVGDAYARPLLTSLAAHPQRWDLSSLRAVMSSGVLLSADAKRELLEHLPDAAVIDTLGSTEGVITSSVTDASHPDAVAAGTFAPRRDVRVISEETGDDVRPGSGEVGLLAVGGRLPIGYHNDPEKTDVTFRTIDGKRYTLAGDHALVEADGRIRLLGRGSACINTGGEKVFAEEVELLLREHPGVADCAVVGVPHERWGQMVVALVVPREGASLSHHELDAYARDLLAGYKRPKHYLVLDEIPRSAAGKPDYPGLERLAAQRLGSDASA